MKNLLLLISVIFTMQNVVQANHNNEIHVLDNNIEHFFELTSPSPNLGIKVIIDTDDKKTVSKAKNKESNKIIIKIKGKKRQGLKIVIGDGFVFRLNNYKFAL